MCKADLHIHTNMSDGDKSIYEIIDMAKKRKVSCISITDHDTVSAFEGFENKEEDVQVIPGVELSTNHNGSTVHILGYFIDVDNIRLKEKLSFLRDKRRNRAKEIALKLKEKANIFLDFDNIKQDTDICSVGRLHIANEMVKMGYVKNTKEAFEKYIGDDMPCFVKNEKLTVFEAVSLIHGAGGLAFLAHPALIKGFNDYEEIINLGIDGIEVFYPKHSTEQRIEFFNLCIKNNLLISGGSDFHSLKAKGKNKIASAYLSKPYLDKIYESIKQKSEGKNVIRRIK